MDGAVHGAVEYRDGGTDDAKRREFDGDERQARQSYPWCKHALGNRKCH